jgi:hypothetical protein
VCTSAGEIPDAVITQGECEKLDPDGLAYYAVEQQARRDQQQLLAAMRAKIDATASTTAAELPTNPPTTTAPALEFWNPLESSGTGNFAGLRLSL